VLDEEPGRGDVVAVDDDTVLAGADVPAEAAGEAVVGSPGPDVVEDDRLRVAFPTCGPPIRKNTSCSAVGLAGLLIPRWPALVPICNSTGELFVPASIVMPAMSTPWTSAALITTAPLTAVNVAMPMPSTTVSAFLIVIVLLTSYTPGVNSRFMPRASWLLMAATESDGLAMKNFDNGIARPGVGPFSQVVPE
jgi:hypothetical protein